MPISLVTTINLRHDRNYLLNVISKGRGCLYPWFHRIGTIKPTSMFAVFHALPAHINEHLFSAMAPVHEQLFDPLTSVGILRTPCYRRDTDFQHQHYLAGIMQLSDLVTTRAFSEPKEQFETFSLGQNGLVKPPDKRRF